MAAPYSPCRIQRRLSPTLSHDLYHFRLRNFLRRHLDALRHPVQFYVRPCFDLLVGHEIDAAAVWSVYRKTFCNMERRATEVCAGKNILS